MDSKKLINTKNIRVSAYTHERILKFSKMFKMNQGEFIDASINIAEKSNFTSETQTEIIQKSTTKDINRLIGFLKTQDKNLATFETKVMQKLESNGVQKTSEKSNEFLNILMNKYLEDFAKVLKKNNASDEMKNQHIEMHKRLFLDAIIDAKEISKKIDNVR